jgi:hypothetical protein
MGILKCSGLRRPRAVFLDPLNDGIDALKTGVGVSRWHR